jgi:hypothetical protein
MKRLNQRLALSEHFLSSLPRNRSN